MRTPVNMDSLILLLVLAAFCSNSQADQHSNRKTVSYIIKGEEANITEFPFLVLVWYPDNGCGGSLISPEWVVTAGHCVNLWIPPSEHIVRLGTSQLGKGGVGRTSLYLVRHEGYLGPDFPSEGFLKNDIALIKIRPVIFSNEISPVKLPLQNERFSLKSMAVVAGFGYRQNNVTSFSTLLMKAKVPYLDTEECKALMWDRQNLLVIPEMQVCFGDLNGGSSICTGDCGGPLIVDDFLVGMTSWGIKQECGEPNNPGVFVRMSYYRDWITEISGV